MAAITLLDGGMGQELVARSGDEPTPLWATRVMIDHPGLVKAIHADYFAAGATVATTNTYNILHDRLVGVGLDHYYHALHLRALMEAHEARAEAGRGLIAGSMGPLGESYRPDLTPAVAVSAPLYAEKARITGFEASFNSEGKIGEVELRSLLGYTYMNPISLNTDPIYMATFSDTTGSMLKYRFKHLAKADIECNYKKLGIGLSARYNSFMRNVDLAFEEGILGQEILVGMANYRAQFNKGVPVFDLRFNYSISEAFKCNLIFNNFTNAEYVSRPGAIQAPRNFVVQLQYTL